MPSTQLLAALRAEVRGAVNSARRVKIWRFHVGESATPTKFVQLARDSSCPTGDES
jgi:hypothetical protein